MSKKRKPATTVISFRVRKKHSKAIKAKIESLIRLYKIEILNNW